MVTGLEAIWSSVHVSTDPCRRRIYSRCTSPAVDLEKSQAVAKFPFSRRQEEIHLTNDTALLQTLVLSPEASQVL